jgi:hypothetical protein
MPPRDGNAHEYKPDFIDGFQSGQETVDGFQSMQDTLSVVHPLHGYDESFALVSEMKLLTPTMEFGRIKCFFKLNCVDPDRIHALSGAMPVAADMRERCGGNLVDRTSAVHRAKEGSYRPNARAGDQVRRPALGALFYPYECVLCAGDDRTDESMFVLNTPGLLSVKVGDGATQAGFRVADPALLRQFLVKALVHVEYGPVTPQ